MLQWERGRQLKEFGGITFTYDAGGVRQSKTAANGVITSYFTEGNRIHRKALRSRSEHDPTPPDGQGQPTMNCQTKCNTL